MLIDCEMADKWGRFEEEKEEEEVYLYYGLEGNWKHLRARPATRVKTELCQSVYPFKNAEKHSLGTSSKDGVLAMNFDLWKLPDLFKTRGRVVWFAKQRLLPPILAHSKMQSSQLFFQVL